MDQGSSQPTDDSPEWGRRRRGTAPPPRANWEQVRDEFDQATRAWEHHRSEEERSWTPPGAGPRQTPGAGPDISALFVVLDTLRRAAPAELQERTTALIREVLLTLRSLIDWYLERLDRPVTKPEVQDIPID
ncbi:MAG: hypothetical protein ACR2J6_06145 [Thermoleophilaceae bacterium]